MDRQLVITFTGRDRGLNQTASAASAAVKGVGTAAQQGAKQLTAYVDSQGRLRNAQGQLINVTKLTQKEITSLRMEFAAAGKDVDGFDEALARGKAGMTGLAATTGVLGGAIAGLFGRGTQEFLAFESGIKQAGVISGASEEQIGALREEVERLGIVTSKAPAEISQTAVALSRAGFSADETNAALEGVARASEATGESLAVVGDITSKTVRTFGLAAEDAGRIGDILVATANNTNTTVSSIGNSLSFVGAQAAGANQPVEDIAVLIGLLGDAGIQGSSAGTQLGNALEKLKLASAGAESEFTSLVRGNEKATEAFNVIGAEVRNTDGSMKSLLDILPELKTNLEGLSQQDQDIVSKALFGVQGGRAIQTLLNATDERVSSVRESIQEVENQAADSSEALLTGLPGALSLLAGSAGATLIKFGELSAVGFEPLVRAATALLNGFLALPGPLQTLVVGSVALTGALAGAVTLVATYNALNIQQKVGDILAAGAIAKKTLTTAASNAVTKAAAVTNEIFNAAITKQTVALAANAAASNTAATAKGVLAGATGTATAATAAGTAATGAAATGATAFGVSAGAAALAAGALAVKLAAIAVRGALVVTALFAISQVFKRSDGAEYAKDLQKAVDELEKLRDEASGAKDETEGLSEVFEKFLSDIKDLGPVEASQKALTRIADTLFDTNNAASRFGGNFGTVISRTQRGAQLAQFAVEEAFTRMGDSIQNTSDLLGRFGQLAPNGRSLGTEELEEFTAAVAEQSKALQEEIELLESQKGESEELDAQLQGEIATRESLIRTLENRVAAQGADTTAVEAATDAARELSAVLDELDSKYKQLNDNAGLVIDQAIADVVTQQAEGLISEAEAERQILNFERTQLQASIDNNRALLADLRAQRLERTDPAERARIDEEILQAQRDLARDERQIAEDRIAANREATDEAEQAEKDATKAAEEAAKERLRIAKAEADEKAEILKQSQEDEARLRQQTFDDQQRSQSEAFEATGDAAQTAEDEAKRTRQAAFEDAQRLEAQRADEAKRDRDAAFADAERATQAAFSQEERALAEKLADRLRSQTAVFNASQRAATEAFGKQQDAAREAAQGRFDAQRQDIERALELEAAIPEDRAAIQARFDEEDAIAARRAEAFAALEAEEKAFELRQQEEKKAFELSQQAEKAAFEENQREIQKQFDLGQQALEAAFEETQRLTRAENERAEELIKLKIDQTNREAKALFEEEQRAIDQAFRESQQALDAAFEESQRQAEREFKESERQRDRENAAAVRAILDSAEVSAATPATAAAPVAQSLRSGGIAEGGVVQVHRDEFIIPPRGSRVISQQESRQLVNQFMLTGSLTHQPVPISSRQSVQPDNSGVPEKIDELIRAVRSQPRPKLKTGGDTYYISGQENPMASAQQARMKNLRDTLRANK